MNKTFAQGKEDIANLCEYFTTNRDQFVAAGVKEAHIRQSLIDPLFEALGWDVSNRERVAPQYREVVPEPSLDDEGQQRAPDYAFRVGSQPRFYGEAKKCGLKIGNNSAAAHQIRRYGWSSKLVLSILTDFEELAVYDTSKPPAVKDKASYCRIMHFKYKDYPERWKELWDVFSREAMLSGAFDQYAASKRKRGTSEVDIEFLKQIEEWRNVLAKNIALRNPTITSEDLNSSVQLTIDRIVFLRMAEDRGLETYQQLLKLCERPGIYTRFIKEVCRRADDKYNSGLFHFHKEEGVSEPPDSITTKIVIDDSVLKPIIDKLYFENGSPYDFRVMPVEILGTVYERFLGKVIRLTAGHTAKIEKKPELRKARGVYYTPAYIVQNIVANTVGVQIEGRSPAELAGTKAGKTTFRVLDMACGSGSFLLGAYHCLIEYCLKWYVDHPSDGTKKVIYTDPKNEEVRLTIEEKKRILTTHIFGVDIDPQAVEVSKLSLLLKALEGENDVTLSQQMKLFVKHRALPNLSDNIKCGNSLICSDYFTSNIKYDSSEVDAVKPFDWKVEFPKAIKAGGFDCIIGNPPYDVVEKDRSKASWPHAALLTYARTTSDYAHSLGRKLNLYRFFLVRGIKFVKKGGRFGMIVPLSLLADISTAATRKRVFTALVGVGADCFPQKDNPMKRVFRDAKLSTMVIAGTIPTDATPTETPFMVRTYPWNQFSDPHKECRFRLSELKLLDKKNLPIPLVDSASWALCQKIYKNPQVVRLGEVGLINITRGEINQTTYRQFIGSNDQNARMLKGVEVGRFRLKTRLSQGEREWFDEKRFLKTETARKNIKLTRIATQRITGVDEKERIVATLMEGPCYFADSTNSIDVGAGDTNELLYLLGLLNSRLFQWRFKMTSTNNNVGTNELEGMPYHRAGAEDSTIRDRIVALVGRLLDLNRRLPASRSKTQRKMIQNQIIAADAEVNDLVYELYDLTDDDTAIVEGKVELVE